MGVASIIPREGGLPSTLIETADEALYEAKEAGRNRFVSSHDFKKRPAKSDFKQPSAKITSKGQSAKENPKKQPVKKKKKAMRKAG